MTVECDDRPLFRRAANQTVSPAIIIGRKIGDYRIERWTELLAGGSDHPRAPGKTGPGAQIKS